MKKVLVSAAVVLCVAISARGADTGGVDVFRQGNAAYAATNYAGAVAAYEKAVSTGFAPGGLYYNLGNAYYRAGLLGKAIASYRRAERLLPRDGDVAENLETARAQSKDKLRAPEMPGAVRAFLFPYYYLGPDEAMWALCGVLLLFFIMLSLYFFVPAATLRRLVMILAAVAVALCAAAGGQMYRVQSGRDAVVIDDRVAGRSGARESTTELFMLNDGTEVVVLERDGGWAKIMVSDKKGWVATNALEVL